MFQRCSLVHSRWHCRPRKVSSRRRALHGIFTSPQRTQIEFPAIHWQFRIFKFKLVSHLRQNPGHRRRHCCGGRRRDPGPGHRRRHCCGGRRRNHDPGQRRRPVTVTAAAGRDGARRTRRRWQSRWASGSGSCRASEDSLSERGPLAVTAWSFRVPSPPGRVIWNPDQW